MSPLRRRPRRPRRRPARSLAVAGTSLVLALSLSSCGGDDETSGDDPAASSPAVDPTTDAPVDSPSEVVTETATETPTEEPAEEPTDPASPEVTSARVGEPVVVGDWEVTVTAIDLDADAEMAEANRFNKEASGRYVLVDYSATYRGSGPSGDAGYDLTWTLTGDDGAGYGPVFGVTPAEADDVPRDVKPGETAELQEVFDVKKKVVAARSVTVEVLGEGSAVISAE